jgi:hypothetical protein
MVRSQFATEVRLPANLNHVPTNSRFSYLCRIRPKQRISGAQNDLQQRHTSPSAARNAPPSSPSTIPRLDCLRSQRTTLPTTSRGTASCAGAVTHLRGALKAEVLNSHLAVQDLKRILTVAYEQHPKWIIFIDKIASKSHFLRYAARYVRRPPLANWRLLEVTDRDVVFVAKDTKAKRLVPTSCQLLDFVRLLAPHVPDSYRHSVRYFGLLSPRARGRMQAALFSLLGQSIRPRPKCLSWRDSLRKYFGVDPLVDSHGKTMHWVRRERPAIG